jgi:hypothetical protein
MVILEGNRALIMGLLLVVTDCALGFAPATHSQFHHLLPAAASCAPRSPVAKWAPGAWRTWRPLWSIKATGTGAEGTTEATGAAEAAQTTEEASVGEELQRLSRSGKNFLSGTSWILKLGEPRTFRAYRRHHVYVVHVVYMWYV